MMPDPLPPPPDLLAQISADLKPVKPAPLPASLAARLAPFALLVPAAVLGIIGMRRDIAALGPMVTWGASAAMLVVAVLLIWMAAREGTPSRRLPQSVVRLALFAAAIVAVALALWTFAVTPPFHPPPGFHRRPAWIYVLICGGGGLVFGSLLIVIFGWFFRNARAARPAITGALYGAGAGIAVNASWRLSCPNSAPWHAIGVHGGAALLVTLLGALSAHLAAKRRRR
jgi:hypothetical protein